MRFLSPQCRLSLGVIVVGNNFLANAAAHAGRIRCSNVLHLPNRRILARTCTRLCRNLFLRSRLNFRTQSRMIFCCSSTKNRMQLLVSNSSASGPANRWLHPLIMIHDARVRSRFARLSKISDPSLPDTGALPVALFRHVSSPLPGWQQQQHTPHLIFIPDL